MGNHKVVRQVKREWCGPSFKFSCIPSHVAGYLLDSTDIGKNEQGHRHPAYVHACVTISYIVFLILLFANLISHCQLENRLNVAEGFILVYFFALCAEELQRLWLKGIRYYLLNITTIVSVLMLLLLLAYFVARGHSIRTGSEDSRMEAMRVASIVMGMAALLACLRLLHYLLPVPKLGPMIVRFGIKLEFSFLSWRFS